MSRKSLFWVGHIVSLAVLAILISFESVLAAPPLPASFYGKAKIGGANVPDGTIVSAWIDGAKIKETATLTYQGESVYALDVDGDDPDTAGIIEGGTEGKTIVFKVGGLVAAPTAIWHAGTSSVLDLNVPQAQPTLTTVTPNSATVGQSLVITLTGANTHFAAGTTSVSFGAGITVQTVTVMSSTALSAYTSIAANAAVGSHSVTVTTGSEIVTRTAAVNILGPGIEIALPPLAIGPFSSQITLPVSLAADTTGRGIQAFQFSLSFDPGVLQPVRTAKDGSLAAGWEVYENHGTAGHWQVAAYGSADLAGSGALLNLVFNVVGALGAQTDLTLDQFMFNEGTPAAAPQTGHFAIRNIEVRGRTLYRNVGGAVANVTLNMTGGTNRQTLSGVDGSYQLAADVVGAHTITPTKSGDLRNSITALDAARIAKCVVNLLPAADCPALAADVNASGQVTAQDASLVARYVVGYVDAGPTAGRWIFDPATRNYPSLASDLVGQDFGAYVVGDVTGNWDASARRAAAYSAALYLANSLQGASDTLVVPISVRDVGTGGPESFYAELSYDPAAFVFDSVSKGAALPSGWEVLGNGAAGTLRIAAFGAEDLSADGIVAEVQFRVQAPSNQQPMLVLYQLDEDPVRHTLEFRLFLPVATR